MRCSTTAPRLTEVKVSVFTKLSIIASLFFLHSFAYAHGLGTSFLHITQDKAGVYQQLWVAAKNNSVLPKQLDLNIPDHCSFTNDDLSVNRNFTCQGKLQGQLSFDNIPFHSELLVRVVPFEKPEQVYLVSGQQPWIVVSENHSGSSWLQQITRYGWIGVEHIALGIDHLLFVVALLCLVGFNRRLVWTITAFTLAHSLTLSASVLDWVYLPQSLVEIIIALSIVHIAVEVVKPKNTLTRRKPWLVAFLFGLIHGLGFAGALKEVGIPDDSLLLSLFAFNAGVEVGQLVIILFLFGLQVLMRKLIEAPREDTPKGISKEPSSLSSLGVKLEKGIILVSIYTIGTFGSYWFIERTIATLS